MNLPSKLTRLLLVLSFVLVAAAYSYGQDAKLQISHLDQFNDKADKVIDVTLDQSLIQLAASFLNPKRSPDEAKIKEILQGLKGVYVKRFEFAKEGEYSPADAETIRSQLNAPGWTRIAGVRSKREGNYDVAIMSEGSVMKGLAVLAAEPKALTVVNIVGPIDLQKFAELEGKLGIPRLGLHQNDGDDKGPKDKQGEKKP